MRVLVNRYPALGRKTGVGQYTTELLRCLKAQAGRSIHVIPPPPLWHAEQLWAKARPYLRPGARPTEDEPAAPASAAPPPSAWKKLLSQGRAAIREYVCASALRGGYDLYHEPNHVPLPIDLPTVVTIHDLSVMLYPEWHPRERVVEFEREFHRCVPRVKHFCAVSEFTRQEMIRLLPVAPERITVTPNGTRPGLGPLRADEVASALRKLRLPSRYLLYVGTIEPRKNLLTLLRAYCGLPKGLRERWPLLLVGSWGWKAGPVADFLDGTGRASGILHRGYLDERHLTALYNGARALVYPSHYEGFGLPPVEMHACGGAVLASTAGALVETVGGQAHLIPPDDVDGWRASMRLVLEDDDWWESLRRGACEAARPYTWERCAAETLRVYRSVCGDDGQVELSPLRAVG